MLVQLQLCDVFPSFWDNRKQKRVRQKKLMYWCWCWTIPNPLRIVATLICVATKQTFQCWEAILCFQWNSWTTDIWSVCLCFYRKFKSMENFSLMFVSRVEMLKLEMSNLGALTSLEHDVHNVKTRSGLLLCQNLIIKLSQFCQGLFMSHGQ